MNGLKQAVLLVMVTAVSIGRAATAETSVPDAILHCRTNIDSAQRMACYDSIKVDSQTAPLVAPPVAQASATVAAPVSSPAPDSAAAPAQATPAAASSFGSEALIQKEIKKEPTSITAHVMGEIGTIKRGTVIPLDNGQEWVSIDEDQYDYDEKNSEVAIERNFIGSYWMSFADAGFRIRVRRVK